MLITWLDIVSTISNHVPITCFEWFKMQVNPYQLWPLGGLRNKQIHANRGFLMV